MRMWEHWRLREKLNTQKSVQSCVQNFKVCQASAFIIPGGPARVLTYLCFFVSSFFLWLPLSSRFKTQPQDSTSRSTRSGSLLFYSSDFRWSPFVFNMRELSYLKNLVHPGTVYSTSSVNPNPSLNTSHALRWLRPHLSLERDDLTVPQLILTIHISIVCWSSHP